MKKRKKRIIVIAFFILGLISVSLYKFKSDTTKLVKIKNSLYTNGASQFLSDYDVANEFTNPIVKLYLYYYKKRFKKRFFDQDEAFSDTGSEVLNSVMALYRNYWVKDYMKTKGDTTDYNKLFVEDMGAYLIDNGLTKVSKENIKRFSNIRSDLKKAIEFEGAFCQFFFLNGKMDIIIWRSQEQKVYPVKTPYDSRDISVLFYKDVILENRQSFISFGDKKTGGWPNNVENVIYCGESYNPETEKFKYSFLTHEANHFFDNEKYPNLSAADLEYRSKLTELVYLQKDMYRILRQFLNGASNQHRNHGHAYANFQVIKDLSKAIFNKTFEGDFNQWKSISVEKINKTAFSLLENNEKELFKNPKIAKVFE